MYMCVGGGAPLRLAGNVIIQVLDDSRLSLIYMNGALVNMY